MTSAIGKLGKFVFPTARWVFQSFIDISVLHVSSLKTFVVGLTAAQKALLTLLGDRYVALYANSG